MSETTRRDTSQATPSGKKPYAEPTLTEYGSVAKLTLIKGTTVVEGSQPNVKKGCL